MTVDKAVTEGVSEAQFALGWVSAGTVRRNALGPMARGTRGNPGSRRSPAGRVTSTRFGRECRPPPL